MNIHEQTVLLSVPQLLSAAVWRTLSLGESILRVLTRSWAARPRTSAMMAMCWREKLIGHVWTPGIGVGTRQLAKVREEWRQKLIVGRGEEGGGRRGNEGGERGERGKIRR